MTTLSRASYCTAALLLSSLSLCAQVTSDSATAPLPAAFDVISIRQNKTNGDSSSMSTTEGLRFIAENVTLQQIIEFGYRIHEDQIAHLTGPAASARFDVEAKILPTDSGPPPKLTDKQLQALIIPLLAERFNLKGHFETREMPVYNLVVLPGGPSFKLTHKDEHNASININGVNDKLTLTGKGVPMPQLSEALSDQVHRTVLDTTGLTGEADFTLKWTLELASDSGPTLSIFTAVQEQLGLKLQPGRGPVKTLVIDHVDMPTEN